MKYRIAIYSVTDGKRKFDHYASDDELRYMRVNSSGKVEQYLPDFGRGLSNFNNAPDVAWGDVSDTHEVEWGTTLKDYNLKLYENDLIEFEGNIMTIALTDYGFCGKYIENGIEMAYTLRSGVRTILGNIHEESK